MEHNIQHKHLPHTALLQPDVVSRLKVVGLLRCAFGIACHSSLVSVYELALDHWVAGLPSQVQIIYQLAHQALKISIEKVHTTRISPLGMQVHGCLLKYEFEGTIHMQQTHQVA